MGNVRVLSHGALHPAVICRVQHWRISVKDHFNS